jgi:hypothetical protein
MSIARVLMTNSFYNDKFISHKVVCVFLTCAKHFESTTFFQEAITKNKKTKQIYETNRNTLKAPFDKAPFDKVSLKVKSQKTKRHVI